MVERSGQPGLRERNKRRKEEAIRAAARSLFEERGFDATTLREVATRADVGFGTVFSYAVDKIGLLAMVYVTELTALPPLFDDRDPARAPIDQLADALGKLFRFWATIPKLSSHVLERMEFYASSSHMEAIVERRRRARDELTRWIVGLQREGVLDPAVPPEQAADTLFAIYTSVVREWSGATPDRPDLGIDRLRTLMSLPIEALTARR